MFWSIKLTVLRKSMKKVVINRCLRTRCNMNNLSDDFIDECIDKGICPECEGSLEAIYDQVCDDPPHTEIVDYQCGDCNWSCN